MKMNSSNLDYSVFLLSSFIYIVTKVLRPVYCRRWWQAFSLDPFAHAYHPDNAKRIAGFRSDNILFRDIIQPQENRENYDTVIFKQAEN